MPATSADAVRRDRAAGTTLVLVPGMLGSPRLWSRQRGRLRSLTDTTVDLALRRPTIDGCADDLLAIDGSLVVLAHSLGAIVAMAAASRDPARFAALVLVATNARPPTAAQQASWDRFEDMTRAGRFEELVRTELSASLLGPTSGGDEALAAQVTVMAGQIGPTTFLDQLAAQRSRQDERPGLRTLPCPVLAVAGSHDPLVPSRRLEEIAALAPRAALQVVPDCGHMVPLEQPEHLTVLLTDWLPGSIGRRARVDASNEGDTA